MVIALMWFLNQAVAAPEPYKLDMPVQLGLRGASAWVEKGKVVGGQAGNGFALLDLMLLPDTNKEKWVLTYGNFKGEEWHGPPGFFQAHLSPDGKKLTLHLQQVGQIKRSDVMPRLASASALTKVLKVVSNHHDKIAHFEFSFRSPVRMRAIAESKQTRQLSLEIERRR